MKKLVKLLLTLSLSTGWLMQASNAQTTYNYTGGSQTYTVPAGVSLIRIEAWGAQGGGTYPGKGGYIACDAAVSTGLVINIYVGGQGQTGNMVAGGYQYRSGDRSAGGVQSGSATPVPGMGSGGGATEVQGPLLYPWFIAGAGGGSGSGSNGSSGMGGNGGNPSTNGGNGSGSITGGGHGNPDGSTEATYGLGCAAYFNGIAYLGGGYGGRGYNCDVGGGGGGGGYTGGGGGGGASNSYGGACAGSTIGGGGGGGSNYLFTDYRLTNITQQTGVNTGNGKVVITDISPPADPTSVSASVNPVCNSSGTQLTAYGADGTVYWYTGGCGTTQVGTGNPITVYPSSNTTYYARNYKNGQFSDGCASLEITFYPAFSSGAIQTTGQTICYNGDPSSIGNSIAANGGDGTITYQWQSSLTAGFESPSTINSNTVSYDPPSGLTVTTWYRRQAKDGTCNTDWNSSSGIWKVTVDPLLSATTSVVDNIQCTGGSNGSVTVSASGGTTAYTYTWSTSPVQTGTTATGLSAGTYWVTVTDANSCTATSSATVTQPSALLASASTVDNVSCNGGSNGSVTVSASGGTTAYTYTWSTSPVQNTQTAAGLTSGTYWVTVTDAHSCSATSSVTITQPSALSASASTVANVNCNGGLTGSVTVSASGGTTAYTYAWSTSPVQTVVTATGLSAGTYWVTVTDAHSCTAISSATLTQPVVLSASASVSSNVTCYQGSNGSVTVSASGGTTAYTYAWSTIPVQTGTTATGLSAGTYWVTVTDAHSCSATSSATLSQPPEVSPGLTGPATVCQNSTGNPYQTEPGMLNYLWTVSAGGTITAGTGTNSITVTWNSSGAQAVSVNYTSPAGCTAGAPTVKNVTVNESPAPVISGPTTVTQGETATYSTPYVSGHTYHWSVVVGPFIYCDPNCITVTWPHVCNLNLPYQVKVIETNTATGCSKTVTLPITIN